MVRVYNTDRSVDPTTISHIMKVELKNEKGLRELSVIFHFGPSNLDIQL